MWKGKKRQRLTFKEKCEVVERVKAGTSKQDILQKYGISDGTLRKLLARESELRNKIKSYDLEKKSSKRSDNMVLDAAVFKWFEQARDRGDPVTGPIIQEKARILNEKFNGPQTFKASNGWLRCFKKRYGIRPNAEKLSSDPSGAAEFSKNLKAKIESENLNIDNIYNADESGILWRQLTACTLALRLELEASGSKECKDRVTALFCANATGSHRIPLLIIGKSKNPRCLSNLITKTPTDVRLRNLESLGVIYTYQRSALMDRCMFMLWYKDEFIPRVLEHQRTSGVTGKVVLLLHNTPSHPSLDELNVINENFEVIYLPLNLTELIQPMDQGLIATTKRLYKTSLLKRLLLSENPEGAVKFLKELNLQDCFDMLSLAWDSVKSSTFQKAWTLLLGDYFVLNNVPASVNIQDPLSNVDVVFNEPESPNDLLSFFYEICDEVSELLSGREYSVEKSREFLLKWFENDHKDNDCGWESIPDSGDVKFVANVKCEPESATEIEKNESYESGSERLSGREYSVEKSGEFLVKWLENDHKDNDCGWESLPDSGDINFVTNVKREPEIVTEIEKSEPSFENPEPMAITLSENCGWESLPDSGDINFVTNVKREPEIVTEIEKSEPSFENPEPMGITSSENCGWESLPDSGVVNSITNVKCEPEIVTEIEKSETFFEYPEPMEITLSDAFDGLMKFKNWLKNRATCLPKHLDCIKELENVRELELEKNA